MKVKDDAKLMKLLDKKERNHDYYLDAYIKYKASQGKFPLELGATGTIGALLAGFIRWGDVYNTNILIISITPLVSGVAFYVITKMYYTRKWRQAEAEFEKEFANSSGYFVDKSCYKDNQK